MEVSSYGGLTKFSQNVVISSGPSVTNHCSPLVTLKCSRSNGYGALTLAHGRSHDLAFHFSAARGQNLVSLKREMSQRSQFDCWDAIIGEPFDLIHVVPDSKSTGIVDLHRFNG